MRFAIVALAACSPAVAPTVSNTRAAEPRTLAGDYAAPHTILVACDGSEMCEEQFEDTMHLRALSGGGLHAKIELVKRNEHLCNFDDDLVPAGAHRWTYDFTPPDEEPCHVELIDHGDKLEIRSHGCRFCEHAIAFEATFDAP